MAVSLWKFGGLTPLRLGKRVWKKIDEDAIFSHAAELSYYFLLALFPLLLFMISMLGLFAGPGTSLRESLFENMARVVPGSASELVQKTLTEVNHSAGGGKVLFGIMAALWAASNGMIAICTTLNIAYHVKETRSWLKSRATALGLTVGLSLLLITAITLVLYGGKIAEFIAAHVGFGSAFIIAWKILQWPVVVVFMLAAFSLVYYFAPNLEKPEWIWVTPGAIAGFVLWFLGSIIFRIYLHYFNNYSATYGSLGAVIILMLWFYITGASILIGGEVNSQIGHAAEEKAKLEARLKKATLLPEHYRHRDEERKAA